MSLMPQDRSKLSPMMQQYLSMKDEHRDQILMFRLGDFYEMFFDDAVTASRELELTLTVRPSRPCAHVRGALSQCGKLYCAAGEKRLQGCHL